MLVDENFDPDLVAFLPEGSGGLAVLRTDGNVGDLAHLRLSVSVLRIYAFMFFLALYVWLAQAWGFPISEAWALNLAEGEFLRAHFFDSILFPQLLSAAAKAKAGSPSLLM